MHVTESSMVRDLLVILFLVLVTARRLLGRSLHVLALHSSRSAAAERAGQGEVNVLLAVDADHE